MSTLFTTLTAILLAAVGFAAGIICCTILNRIPAEWLCDYDEEPSQELLSGKRFTVKKNGIVLGVMLAIALTTIFLMNGLSQTQLITYVLCFVLTLVAAADAKYQIIPDQFTAAVLLVAVDFALFDFYSTQTFITRWFDPILGAIVGGGGLMALDIFSMVVLKKEGFGFGDVKLLAALGIMFGWKYIIVLLVTASLIAAVHFLYLIFRYNGRLDKDKYLPMAPYLCIGAALTIIFVTRIQSLLDLYKDVLEMKTLP